MPSKSDKLFQKRKPTSASKLRRRSASVEPAKRFLIVCEGSITEPEYFRYQRERAVMPNIEVEVCGEECGSSPISVVNYAEQRAKSEGSHASGGYAVVYCVFDRDEHADFEKAVSKILTLNKPQSKFPAKTIYAVCSYPCFEIWLLFHYKYTRKPFSKTGAKTATEIVINELKKIPLYSRYKKSLTNDILNDLYEKREAAISNALKAAMDVEQTAERNPSTNVHELIKIFFPN